MSVTKTVRGTLSEVIESFGNGELKTAWFTSFNLDPHFVEKNVLPMLADADEPVRAADYENLQKELQRVDVRFFADFRFIDTGAPKRTPVPVTPVDPAAILPATGRTQLFHPKVIFLHGTRNGAPAGVLGVGSMNLSRSGWGFNRECFVMLDVEDRDNGTAVLDFFARLSKDAGFIGHLAWLRETWAARLPTAPHPGWRFVSSITHAGTPNTFLELLAGPTGRARELTVWSPYFPRQLAAWINSDELRDRFERIRLVPDLSVNGRPRIHADQKSVLEACSGLTFLKDLGADAEDSDLTRLVHAKVWIANLAMAVGSWNFSPSATLGVNVEAGIVLEISEAVRARMFAALIAMPLGQLDDDAGHNALDDAIARTQVAVELIADWKEMTFRAYCALAPSQLQRLAVRLPGMEEALPLAQIMRNGEALFRRSARTLRTNRLFRIFDREQVEADGQPLQVGTGFVVEVNRQARRGWQHTSLDTYLDGLLSPKDGEPPGLVPATPSVKAHPNGTDPTNEPPDNDDPEPDVIPAPRIPNWFTTFHALYRLRLRIQDCTSQDELLGIGFRETGCLEELCRLVDEQVANAEAGKSDGQSSAPSRAYMWFLVEEVKELTGLYNRRVKGRERRIAPPEDIYLPVPPSVGAEKFALLLETIRKDIRHGWN
jgi:hypothetical protein